MHLISFLITIVFMSYILTYISCFCTYINSYSMHHTTSSALRDRISPIGFIFQLCIQHHLEIL